MKKLEEIAKKMGGGSVSTGFLEGATYPDGTPVAFIAFLNEYGHQGQFPAPPRSFFRGMIAKESPTWPAKMARLAKVTNYDGEKVLGMMGADIKGALQQSITETNSPPLSETTLMLRKMFGNSPEKITATDVLHAQSLVKAGKSGAGGTQAKPLDWTGHMINSVDYEVNK